MPDKNLQEQIKGLERSVAQGDLPGMARLITALHTNWDTIPRGQQLDILKLEAAFLTLVNMHAKGNA